MLQVPVTSLLEVGCAGLEKLIIASNIKRVQVIELEEVELTVEFKSTFFLYQTSTCQICDQDNIFRFFQSMFLAMEFIPNGTPFLLRDSFKLTGQDWGEGGGEVIWCALYLYVYIYIYFLLQT